MRLEDKVIIVTGSVAGMGQSMTERFLEEGAKVVGVDFQEERLKAQEEELNKQYPGKFFGCPGDIAKKETNEAMVALAVEKFGHLDVLVNNAGIMDHYAPVGTFDDAEFDRVMAINLHGPLFGMRAAVQQFIAQSDDEDETPGVILNICSIGALHNTAGVAYGASKAGLLEATKHTAFAYKDQKIRSNAILPGGILTEMAANSDLSDGDPKGVETLNTLMGFGSELGMPEMIADVATFLVSDESEYVTGESIRCDGGWMSV